MKLIAIGFAACALLAGKAFSQGVITEGGNRDPNPGTTAATAARIVKRIGASEAEKHYDESVFVTGMVAQVSIRPNMVYLNFEKPYPSNTFTAIIFPKFTNQFGDLSKLADRQVEVSGKVVKYRDKPELVLESSNQLTVVRGAAEPKKAAKPATPGSP